MIELYNIIEAANSLIHPTRGTLILHRSMKEHPKFKVYKKFCYDLYLVNKDDKNKLLSFDVTNYSPMYSLEDFWRKADIEFLPVLIEWLSSNNYNELKYEL